MVQRFRAKPFKIRFEKVPNYCQDKISGFGDLGRSE